MLEKFAIFCINLIDWFKSERCFVKYFIDAFKMTNNNVILLTILLLMVFAVSMYMIVSDSSSISNIITLFIVILIMSALAAGIFYSIKKSIQLQCTADNTAENTRLTLGIFFSGIGKYYLSFISMLILFLILASCVILLTFQAANHFICSVSELGLDSGAFFTSLANTGSLETILANMNRTEQMHFRDWNRLFLLTTQLFTFLLIFWIPETVYTKKNVFSTLYCSVKKVIKDFPNALCIYLTILFLNYLLAALTMLAGNNGIALFILSILSFYLVIYDFYAIFLYYKAKYIDMYDRG